MKVTGVTIRKRLMVGMVLISIGFITLIVRLAYVQLWEGKDLADLAEDSWRR